MKKNKLSRLLMAAALAASLAVPAGAVFFPTEVRYPVEDGEAVYKVYDLATREEVNQIPRESISYHGQAYRFLDMTVEPQTVTQTKEYVEAYSGADALTDDPASILAVLEPKKEVTTEDGFTGTVTLDPETLTVEPDTYESASYTRKLTRTYPSMAEMDVAYLPQTLTEGGVTYTLADCSWSPSANPNPYDVERGGSYTAVATYSTRLSGKNAKTYKFSVNYVGTLEKETVEAYHCVAVFEPFDAAELASQGARTGGSGVGWKISTGVLGVAAAALGAVLLLGRKGGKKLFSLLLVLGTVSVFGTVSANAMSYTVPGAAIPDTAQSTSITGYELPAADVAADYSKNAAYAPPGFGTTESYLPNRAEKLIDLRGTDGAGYGVTVGNGSIDGSATNPAIRIVNGFPAVDDGPAAVARDTRTGFTALSGGDYYADGRIGQISIPTIGVNFGVYEGTDTKTMNKGAGHFTDTSIWDGNVCLAAHNRGVANNFGQIQNLRDGDRIELTTVYGTRVYSVYRVAKIAETDQSILTPSSQNMLTLTTCVANEREARYVVQARLVEG